jgi:hypothetical protein
VQWIEEDAGYPYYVQPVHSILNFNYIWQAIWGQIRRMLYRLRPKRAPLPASERMPLCYEAATLRKLTLEQARLLVLGDFMIGNSDPHFIRLLFPEWNPARRVRCCVEPMPAQVGGAASG